MHNKCRLPDASLDNSVLICSCVQCSTENSNVVWKVINKMELVGVKPNSETYFYLINNCKCKKKISKLI